MNKKNLSVVMAGAMLATSVAPVLADTTTGTEIAYDQLKVFKADLLAKMEEKKISDNSIFKTASNPFVSASIQTELAANNANEFSSAYGIKITGKDGKVKLDTKYTTDSASSLITALDNLTSGDKVEVYERETTLFKGALLPGSGIVAISDPVKYSSSNSSTASTEIKVDSSNNKLVDTVTNSGAKVTVTTEKLLNPGVNDDVLVLSYDENNNKVDGRLALDKDGNLIDITKNEDVQKFVSFGELVNWNPCTEKADKGEKLVSTYTIGEKPADSSKETLNLSDVYDGITLTSRGTDIAADLSNAARDFEMSGSDSSSEAPLVKLSGAPAAIGSNGLTSFTVSYYKNSKDSYTNTNPEKVITVVSNDKDSLTGLHNILKDGSFNVGVVAGANRYETAVNVAKQQKITKTTFTNGGNIVLVNGMSLVDGLAASPLAAKLTNAPLLLSESDSLPTATKSYINDLVDGLSVAEKKKVTINLVGGTSVLSESLVNELKGMGFNVVRYGGDNREETSVTVAEALNSTQKAFVVGAFGEADAMSISAVAAKDKTPIIVSNVHGISDDALSYMRKRNVNDVMILGGTKVVSSLDEEKINDALPGVKTMRIAGENRLETNAKVIETYYNATANGVVAVKDGVKKSSELVDALSAANYAAVNESPIVLASSKVSDSQKTALLKAKKSSATGNGYKTVQVGEGAERTVLETLADLFGAKNK